MEKTDFTKGVCAVIFSIFCYTRSIKEIPAHFANLQKTLMDQDILRSVSEHNPPRYWWLVMVW